MYPGSGMSLLEMASLPVGAVPGILWSARSAFLFQPWGGGLPFLAVPPVDTIARIPLS